MVANVGKDGVEDAHLRGVVAGDEQATLDHQLQESHRFHRDAFAAGIGPADDQNPLFSMDFNVLRKGFFPGQAVGQLQQGMKRGEQMQPWFFSDLGKTPGELSRKP